MTLQKKLYAYFLKYPDEWHPKGNIERMHWIDSDGKTAMAENIGRRLRELEDGSHHLNFQGSAIAVTYDHHRNAKYRLIPPDWRPRYLPSKLRTTKTTLWKEHAKREAEITNRTLTL